MKLDRARVRNFRSIEDTEWVNIEGDLTALLGKNESGKTAFLEAIDLFDSDQAFDETDINDGLEPDGRSPFPVTTLEFNPDSQTGVKKVDEVFEVGDRLRATKYQFPASPRGTAHKVSFPDRPSSKLGVIDLQFGQEILKCIEDDMKLIKHDLPEGMNDDFSRLENIISEASSEDVSPEAFLAYLDDVMNYLETLQFHQLDSFELNQPVYTNMIEKHFCRDIVETPVQTATILNTLPPIVYHSQQDSIQDEVRQHNLGSEEYRTFANLLRLTNIDMEEFDQLEFRDQAIQANRASDDIQVEMNEYWAQKTVDVHLDYNGQKFVILIEDTVLNGNVPVDREPRPPSQRSRGFQWFFSFYINFKREARKSSENSILLLDDPAVYLHPEGKKNWLSAVESVADDNQVIYTSHSPYLIRKEHPERIRIVEDKKDEGTQITSDFIESSESSLEPLREALGIGLGDTPFAAKRKILVEGPSDYYILTGLAHYSKEWGDDILEWDDLSLMVMDGANKMIDVAKWVASEDFDYALLLDNDEQGKSVAKEIDKHHDEIRDGEVVLLDEPDGPNYQVEIEDMFPPTFYVDCVNAAYDEILDDFDPIEISENEDGWDIEGAEYRGRKIVSVLDDIFDDRGDGDFDNKVVAKEIMRRLKAGDVSESHIEAFKPILRKLNAAA